VISVNVGWTVERFVEEQKEKLTKVSAKPSSMNGKENGKTRPSQMKEAKSKIAVKTKKPAKAKKPATKAKPVRSSSAKAKKKK